MNTTGMGNIAIGAGPMSYNSTGSYNVAIGTDVLDGSGGTENV
jgi:hypothetical protein